MLKLSQFELAVEKIAIDLSLLVRTRLSIVILVRKEHRSDQLGIIPATQPHSA